MSTVAVANPVVLRRYSLSDHIVDDSESSMTRRPVSSYDFVQRRKPINAMRSRQSWRKSWRNSWKNILPKTLSSTQSNALKSRKKNRKKETDSNRKIDEESLHSRKKLEELLQLWHTEVVDSEESSDEEEEFVTNHRRSWSPRVIGGEDSSEESSNDDDECMVTPVSLYVSEGPSRMLAELGASNAATTSATTSASVAQTREVAAHRLLERIDDKTLQNGSGAMIGPYCGINHSCNKNSVIASKQINNIERSFDNTFLDDLSNLTHQYLTTFQLTTTTSTHKIGTNTRNDRRSKKCMQYAKDDLELEKYRQLTHQGVLLEGLIRLMCKDSLSLALENSKLQNEKVIKTGCNNNKTSFDPQSSTTTQSASSNMNNCFNTQELNTIRRFLGLSLQQINARKTVNEEYHEVTEVKPDYPSSYAKNKKRNATINDHDDGLCNLQCEYKEFGCGFMDTTCAVAFEEHMKMNIEEHLSLVSKTAIDQKRQLQEQSVVQQQQQLLIKELIETVRNLKQLIDDQTTKNHIQTQVVNTLKKQLEEQQNLNQLSQQFQTCNNHSTVTTSSPTSRHVAETIWPIKNFTKLLKQARNRNNTDPMIGEPFYSEQHGYKLCLWVYLNGRGKHLGISVSVYARILPGEHDGILNWPVRPTYTFTLFDQSEGEKENIVRTRRINTIKKQGEKHAGVDRPGGGDRSVIVGFDDFITHEQLFKMRYLKDDCFYLKLEATLDF